MREHRWSSLPWCTKPVFKRNTLVGSYELCVVGDVVIRVVFGDEEVVGFVVTHFACGNLGGLRW